MALTSTLENWVWEQIQLGVCVLIIVELQNLMAYSRAGGDDGLS